LAESRIIGRKFGFDYLDRDINFGNGGLTYIQKLAKNLLVEFISVISDKKK
jgi:hypothetical protein